MEASHPHGADLQAALDQFVAAVSAAAQALVDAVQAEVAEHQAEGGTPEDV